jgi:serine beta-lactamase-like protein LACTB
VISPGSDPSPGKESVPACRITPVRPIHEILAEAVACRPPQEAGEFLPADLVDLAELGGGLRFDIRYATETNFLGVKLYTQPRAYLQRAAALALLRAQKKLAGEGYGLLIYDAYRPWYVTKMFWEATPAKQRIFVADPAKGSRHNRGCAVDVTLVRLADGKPVEMVSGFDEFSDRAYPDYPGGTDRQRFHRNLLRRTMERHDFLVHETEWWHFDYKDWYRYPILNLSFEHLRERGPFLA